MGWIAASLAVVVVIAHAAAWAEPPKPPPKPPVPEVAGRVLSLNEAVAIAMATEPEIQARLSDYAAARARVFRAIAPMLPQVSGSMFFGRQAVVFGVSGVNVQAFDATNNARGQASLSQLLFDFGRNLAETDRERKQADIAKEEIEVQRDDIALAVKEAYFNLLAAKRAIVVTRQALERAQLNLRSARGFYEVGTRPKSDVTRAEVDVANAQVDLIRAQNLEKLARVALNTAMGIPVDTPTEVENILKYEPFVVDHATLLDEALKGRPEYRRAKLRVEAADAAVRRDVRDFFPVVTGNAFYGATTTDFLPVWELGVTLNWNIFDGGAKIARYRESAALREAAEARVRVQQLDIWEEVERASLNIGEAEQRIQAVQKAVESARENFRLAQGRFDAGVGTIIELTDAQLELTRAQLLETETLRDLLVAVAQLERALGRR